MTPAALLALFRAEVRDEVTPYLWSDTEVLSYLDDAQKMFCRLVVGIADASSAITRITATAGSEFIDISPRILKLRSARRLPDGRTLELLNVEDLETSYLTSDYGSYGGYRFDNRPGPLRALVLGMEANRARLVSIPDEDTDIALVVYRMPLEDIAAVDDVLEIDEQHHRHLLLWAKHLAHMKQDAETYDRGRSEEFRAGFLGYCSTAKAERERREHKYRTVAYGGY